MVGIHAAQQVADAAWAWSTAVTGELPTQEGLTQVGPGTAGFIATFAIVGATVLLMISMSRHIRRIDFNERQRQAAVDAERVAVDATAEAVGTGAADGGAVGKATPDDSASGAKPSSPST